MRESPALQTELEEISAFLSRNLGPNLQSLILYGSAARGEFIEQRSDINLLVVLEASTAQAHEVLRELRLKEPRMEPFVVERAGFTRATQVFGLKFMSIRRHYRVLHGEDLLKDLELGRQLQVLLAEQECRNLRMRLTHAYVTAGSDVRRYQQFLMASTPRLFIVLSDVARCGEVELPDALEASAEALAGTFSRSAQPMHLLWQSHLGREKLSARQLQELHGELVQLLSAALNWIERKWPNLPI